MSSSEPVIHCLNPDCTNPLNSLGRSVCEACQTPLVYRYLWATGDAVDQIPPQAQVADRYYVVAPQIWLDTQPGQAPNIPQLLPDEIIPYLRLYPQRLHLPEIYGFCHQPGNAEIVNVLLLENAPIDPTGHLYPTLLEAWPQAKAVRQVYWLWQILQLWTHLLPLGVASSLLVPDNLRVEGWRVRLRELFRDRPDSDWEPVKPESSATHIDATDAAGDSDSEEDTTIGFARVPGQLKELLLSTRFPDKPTLQALADSLFPLALGAQTTVTKRLQEICEQMQLSHATATHPSSETQGLTKPGHRALDEPRTGNLAKDAVIPMPILVRLNHLLLEQAAQLPLQLQIWGISDTGPQRTHNEDACYPTQPDLRESAGQPIGVSGTSPLEPQLVPHLTLVCDGIGGHEGGEVASQLAVQSLKLQMQAFLSEVTEQSEPLMPEQVAEQMQAVIRVVNNLIAAQNDAQGREARRRMGTTLVLALQLPQKLKTSYGTIIYNANELYLAHVGDSRAYWITPQYCHPLTVDDDVSVREVRLGRSLYRDALNRPDAGALTQALGTRSAEFLHPTVQRFILEEDGLLLLCSDGLSDNNWVEQSWAGYAEPVIQGQLSLEAAVQSLVELANQKNGYDNTSVVMTYCRVSPGYPQVIDPGKLVSTPSYQTPELSEASRALLYGETTEEPATAAMTSDGEPQLSPRRGRPVLLGLLLLLLSGVVGVTVWAKLDPGGFQQLRDRWLPPNPPANPSSPQR